MKIPHFLFVLINWVMVTILRSPLHGIFSGSILAMRYTGVKSGRIFTVPARYHRQGEVLHLITSTDTRWWPNFRGGHQAQVLVRGAWLPATIEAVTDVPDTAGPLMREMWQAHPSDAAYMNVKLRNGEPDPDDFARAVKLAVVITIVLRKQEP